MALYPLLNYLAEVESRRQFAPSEDKQNLSENLGELLR